MSDNPDATVVIAHVPTEAEATLIADALKERGVHAEVSGALTAGFRAEAPGMVRVIVREAEVDEARAALESYRQEMADIDWSKVDLGKPE